LLTVIIPHFLAFPLVTAKSSDFALWSEVVKIMSSKGHLNLRGFLLVLTYYASINRGVSKKVANAYPDITPSPRPDPVLPANLNPN